MDGSPVEESIADESSVGSEERRLVQNGQLRYQRGQGTTSNTGRVDDVEARCYASFLELNLMVR